MAHIDLSAPMEYTRSFMQENISIAKRKTFGNRTTRVEIIHFNPAYSVEHLLEVTFAEWKIAKEELDWTPSKEFKNFALVLLGTTRSFWDETVTSTYANTDLHTDKTFAAARSTFINKVVGVRYSRDIILHNLNHTTHKPHWQPVLEHHCRFLQIYRNTMLLPAGVKPELTPGELKEAYYRSFDRKNRLVFLQAGRNYNSATMDTINDFMKIRQEMEHISIKPERRSD